MRYENTLFSSGALALFNVSFRAVAQSLPDLPDATGRAGMMAAVVLDEDGQEAVLAAGGANFPDGLPWEGERRGFTVIYSYCGRLRGSGGGKSG